MAHKEQIDFCDRVKKEYPSHFINKKVLDIGSLDINGNNRYLFENCEYLGIDVGKGKNVDLVCLGHELNAPDNYYDTIISTETFEHDMFYEKTIENIIRMLKPGGLFLFTCASEGRPEHGTRRTRIEDAPLLDDKDDWGDYYKNLNEEDIRKIKDFDLSFPDGKFEYNTDCFICCDLYFYGIKRKYPIFNEDIFVIGEYCDTIEKEQILIRLINLLKTTGIPILLCGHYPIKPEIQSMVDYYIFDKDNPILNYDDFSKYNIIYKGSTIFSDYWTVEIKSLIIHEYAVWSTMRNAFNFVKYLGKKYIHYFEYDNLPDIEEYVKKFIYPMRYHDAVVFKDWQIDYYITYVFSIRTDIGIDIINRFKTKEEYFFSKYNQFTIENVFYYLLNEFSNNICITDYKTISKENYFNISVIDRGVNNPGSMIYLACDDRGILFSVFEKRMDVTDFEITIDYNGKKIKQVLNQSVIINNNYRGFISEIDEYIKGENIKIYENDVEILNIKFDMDVEKYRELNKIIHKK